MSTRGIGEPEPGYWENAFKFWYTGYKHSKFRQGMIHHSNIARPEIDTHDVSHETKAPSQHREHYRLYRAPSDVPYPRECSKIIDKYVRCRWDYKVYSYADDVPQCNDVKDALFDGCPHWVLENLAFRKRFYRRAETIDNLTYKRAMEVSDYNK